MRRKFVVFTFITGFLLYNICLSQILTTAGIQVNVKGKVTDEITGKPVEVTLEIKNPKGEKFRIKTNSIDGTYQQILNSGEKYEITFLNFDILKKTEILQVVDSKIYGEQLVNFTVKKFTKGLPVFSFNAFEDGKASLNDSFREFVKTFEQILIFNRAPKFEIVVSSHDTYSESPKVEAPIKKKTKSSAKKQTKGLKTNPNPEPALIKNLVDSRIVSLNTMLESLNRFSLRISVKADYSLQPYVSGSVSISENPDLIINVSEINNIFE
ncbi:MAG: hypothetical protein ABSG15_03610 [FCB group bacterium]|jgi:hypothetical protein